MVICASREPQRVGWTVGLDSTDSTYYEGGSSLESHPGASHALKSPSGRLPGGEHNVRLSDSTGRKRSKNRSGEVGLMNGEADNTREAGGGA